MRKEVDYKVVVNGKEIELFRVAVSYTPEKDEPPVYACRFDDDVNCYGIGSFDSDGPVQVEIRCKRSLAQTVILPENSIPEAQIHAEKIAFKLKKHGTYIFEPEGYKGTPLILFFNPSEKNIPNPDDPKVHWFGPGLHRAGMIELKDGETLYLAPGAVVEGALHATGDNIRVCGRGILTQRAIGLKDVRFCLDFDHCRNLTFEGIIAADPAFWNVVFRDCDGVVMDNVKVCGGRFLNDDGIDICNSSNVTIRNCFIRAQDDIIAPKGLHPEVWDPVAKKRLNNDEIAAFYETGRGVEHILIEHCVFWCDTANVFRVGYECTASMMADIVARDCDVVHVSDILRDIDFFWSNQVFCLQASHGMMIRDLLFEDIRIHMDVADLPLVKILPQECPPWVGFGNIRNCTFRNIAVRHAGPDYKGVILIAGEDEAHKVSGIRFENITINGKPVSAGDDNVIIRDFTEDITFS